MADLANEGRWPGPGGGIAVVTVMGKKWLSGVRGNEMLLGRMLPRSSVAVRGMPGSPILACGLRPGRTKGAASRSPRWGR